MATTRDGFRPFGIAHVPWRVRCVLTFGILFYSWLRKNRPVKKTSLFDPYPLLIWEDREVEGTFGLDFVGVAVYVVMKSRPYTFPAGGYVYPLGRGQSRREVRRQDHHRKLGRRPTHPAPRRPAYPLVPLLSSLPPNSANTSPTPLVVIPRGVCFLN